MQSDVITMAHGSGGAESAALMRDVFSKHFNNETLARLEDSAVISLEPSGIGTSCVSGGVGASCVSDSLEPGGGPFCALAVSTDSFVVTPLFFPGGDIGKLAVYGTVNDVLMSGAEPRWLTCAFIIEAGLKLSLLDTVCASMAEAAAEAGVTIIAGDTKVVEGRSEDGGLMINTTGIGMIAASGGAGLTAGNPDAGHFEQAPVALPRPSGIRPGDAVILSGKLGDHHAAILSARLGIKNGIKSDCALLAPVILALRKTGAQIHAMRDVTRGGLGVVLNELAAASDVSIELKEEHIPVAPEVQAFCGIMGLDPLYMGNEGKLVLAVPPEEAERALAALQATGIGRYAAIVGKAAGSGDGPPTVSMRTRIGGAVRIDLLYGEGLPRIC